MAPLSFYGRLPSNNHHNGFCQHVCWVVCDCLMHIEMLHVFDNNFDFTLVFYCIVDRTVGVGPSESPTDSHRTDFESQCTDRHPRGHKSSSPKPGGSTNQQVMYTINQSINVSNVVSLHNASLWKVSWKGAFCCLMYITSIHDKYIHVV